jgi:uncharacterized protein
MTTLLKEEIQRLVSLQRIDSRIYQLKQEKESRLPEKLRLLTAAFKEKKDDFLCSQERFKQVQLKKKDREVELASKEEALRKSQGQLYQLKTNKEYQAKLSEIGAIKADISVAEEDVLKAMDEIEKEKENLQKAQELLEQEEKNNKEKEDEINQELKKMEAEIASLDNQRREFTDGIKPEILTRYENLLKMRNGLAIVPVIDSSCGACYMRVTHQKINEIKMYDELVFCESCVRILYMPEDCQE